jgi:hypothetical protein
VRAQRTRFNSDLQALTADRTTQVCALWEAALFAIVDITIIARLVHGNLSNLAPIR